MGRRTFVIDIDRSAARWDRAVIDNRAQLRRHPLTDTISKCRGLLPVEVAFESMTDRFMEQNTWPTRTQDYVHCAGRRVSIAQVQNRLTHRRPNVVFDSLGVDDELDLVSHPSD